MIDSGSQPAKRQIDTANTDAHSLLVTAAVEENPATKSSIPLSNSGASSSVNLEPPPAAKERAVSMSCWMASRIFTMELEESKSRRS